MNCRRANLATGWRQPGRIELRGGVNNPVVQNPTTTRSSSVSNRGDRSWTGCAAELGPRSSRLRLRVEWISPKAVKAAARRGHQSIFFASSPCRCHRLRFGVRLPRRRHRWRTTTLALGAMVLARREVTLSTVAAL
jgi:hypothetical protein